MNPVLMAPGALNVTAPPPTPALTVLVSMFPVVIPPLPAAAAVSVIAPPLFVILPVEKLAPDNVNVVVLKLDAPDIVTLDGVLIVNIDPEIVLIPATANGLEDSVRLIVEPVTLLNGVKETFDAVVVNVTDELLFTD